MATRPDQAVPGIGEHGHAARVAQSGAAGGEKAGAAALPGGTESAGAGRAQGQLLLPQVLAVEQPLVFSLIVVWGSEFLGGREIRGPQ